MMTRKHITFLVFVLCGFVSCRKNTATPHFTLRELYVVRTVNGENDTLYRTVDERVEVTAYPDFRQTDFLSISKGGKEHITLTSKYGFSPVTQYNLGCPLGNLSENEYLYLFSRDDNHLGIRQKSVSFFHAAGSLIGFPLESEEEGLCNGYIVMSPL